MVVVSLSFAANSLNVALTRCSCIHTNSKRIHDRIECYQKAQEYNTLFQLLYAVMSTLAGHA